MNIYASAFCLLRMIKEAAGVDHDFSLDLATAGDQAFIKRISEVQLGPVLSEAWGHPDAARRVVAMARSMGTTLVARVQGQAAGFVFFTVTRQQRLHVGALVVDAPYQGRGLGTFLLTHCRDLALRLGLNELELWVETNNPRARTLYDRLGFEVSGVPAGNTVEMRNPLLPPADRLSPLALLHVAARAARAAGSAIQKHFRSRRVVDDKGARDVLAEADLAAEAAALRVLRSAYPGFDVYSEEAGATRQGSPYAWVVDPLDGTNNFVLGIPYYCTSIALLRNGEPTLGVVYQPVLEECFVAEAGAGAWQDGRPLRAAAPADPARATLSWVQGHGVGSNPAAAALRRGLEAGARRLLSTWAPALDWCLLARGDVAGLVSYDSEPEDQYAGALLAREAGALVTDFAGASWRPGARHVVAAAPPLHGPLRAFCVAGA